MRIHELVPTDEAGDLFIFNDKTEQTLVLTPEGAVFEHEDTRDVTNMAVAFGALFTSDQWRAATPAEITAFLTRPKQRMLELVWTLPKKPQLTLVKKEE